MATAKVPIADAVETTGVTAEEHLAAVQKWLCEHPEAEILFWSGSVAVPEFSASYNRTVRRVDILYIPAQED